MIQITPQMRILVAVEPADFRKGIDGLARLCQETLVKCPRFFVPASEDALRRQHRDDDGGDRGHGRNGADAYHGAEKIEVSHESLQPGDACPDCEKGTVYETSRPGVLVRITGQAPVAAKVFQLQKLRCHLCGKVFTAAPPEGVGSQKYDAMAGSMIALLKYGTGMPFNRFEGLQGSLGIPLPASTQWDIVHDLAKQVDPVHAELIRQAAQGDVVYNDDTTVKILELISVAMCWNLSRWSTATMRSRASRDCHRRPDCVFTKSRAARRWRDFKLGSPGSSRSVWWSPTHRWAEPSRTCSNTGRS